MIPFGQRIRDLRQTRGITQAQMASALGVSPAYLSALEHGHRGRPSPGLVQQISAFFNLAWDEVDELKSLARLSAPKCTINTAGLHPKATELANLLAQEIGNLDEATMEDICHILKNNGRYK